MKQVFLQNAFVLHRRSYRETSFLIDCFTKEEGRLTLIARGARQSKTGLTGLLQPFIPLLISWAGRGELMHLSHAEVNVHAPRLQPLQGDALFAGFYLNELIVRLLQRFDPAPALFSLYEKTLLTLQSGELDEKILRLFERQLLDELGYGLFPKTDALLETTILPDAYYRFIPEQGLVQSEQASFSRAVLFSGKNLLAFAKENWQEGNCLQEAKRLTRLALGFLLGCEPLQSRKLFL